MWKFKLMKKHIYPIKNFYFEDCEFCIPNNFDAYLTTDFGNWQEVPENIWTHNTIIKIK